MTVDDISEFLHFVEYQCIHDSTELYAFIKKHDNAIEKKFHRDIPNTNNYLTFVVESDCYYFTVGNDFLNVRMNYYSPSSILDYDLISSRLHQNQFWYAAYFFLTKLIESLDDDRHYVRMGGSDYIEFEMHHNSQMGFLILTDVNDDTQHKLISPVTDNTMISFEMPYDDLMSFFVEIKEYFENYFEQWIPIIKKAKLLYGIDL